MTQLQKRNSELVDLLSADFIKRNERRVRIPSDPVMVCHFDGLEPYETNFYGQANGHRGQVATVTGGVAFRPGKFGKGVQVAEADTNIILDPSCTGILAPRYAWYTNLKTSVSSNHSKYGTTSLKVIVGLGEYGGSYDGFTGLADVNIAYTFTASVYVKSISAGFVIARLIVGYSDTSSDVLFHNFTEPTDGFVDVSFTSVPAGRTVSAVYAYIINNTGTVAEYYYDGLILTKKAYATPYFDGSFPGCSWSGTAHASTSVRSVGYIKYNAGVVNQTKGTIACWINPLAQKVGGYLAFWDLRDTDNNAPHLYHQYGVNKLYLYNGSANQMETTIDFGVWSHVVFTYDYDDDLFNLYVNGAQVDYANNALSAPDMGNYLFVGNNVSGNVPANGLLDDLAIFDRALTAEEVKAIYESNAPLITGTDFSEGTIFDYVPTWIATTINPTLGNGTLTGQLSINGNVARVWGKLLIGSTTNLGSGVWRFYLPINVSVESTSDFLIQGTFWINDANNTANRKTGVCGIYGGNSLLAGFFQGSASALSSTVPFAWEAGDTLQWDISYPI